MGTCDKLTWNRGNEARVKYIGQGNFAVCLRYRGTAIIGCQECGTRALVVIETFIHSGAAKRSSHCEVVGRTGAWLDTPTLKHKVWPSDVQGPKDTNTPRVLEPNMSIRPTMRGTILQRSECG